MTEAEWDACTDVEDMLEFVQDHGQTRDRKLRLFAVTCCRRVWELLNHIEKDAVILMERFLEEQAGEPERAAAFEAVREQVPAFYGSDDFPVAQDLLDRDARFAAEAVLLLLPADPRLGDSEKKAWCDLVRDIFGPRPFKPLTVDPSVLRWNDRAVVKLAQAAYDNRHPKRGTLDNIRLAVLADALEEAGCADQEILSHCRSRNDHVRGCWVIDLLLGKDGGHSR